MNKLKLLATELVKLAAISEPNRDRRDQKVERIREEIDPTFDGRRVRERRR